MKLDRTFKKISYVLSLVSIIRKVYWVSILMNIKSCFERIIKELGQFIFSDLSHIDKNQIIKSVKITLNNIKVFSKQIEPKNTAYFELLVKDIDIDELVITKSMINEAYIRFKTLKENINNIKFFINQYFNLLRFLLVFNTSEECCKICEGYLFYYFDEDSRYLLKNCSTCGTLFNADDDEIILSKCKEYVKLRPARKEEIKISLKQLF